MNPTHAQVADAHDRVLKRFKFQPGAHLDAIGRLVVFGKAHDYRVPEETAGGQEAVRAGERHSIRISSLIQQIRDHLVVDERSAGKCEQARGRIE